MVTAGVKLRTMPDIQEYVTVTEAAARDDVPYTAYWIRRLVQEGKLKAVKVGDPVRGTWLVHLPSLLEYVKRMADLGTDKHKPF